MDWMVSEFLAFCCQRLFRIWSCLNVSMNKCAPRLRQVVSFAIPRPKFVDDVSKSQQASYRFVTCSGMISQDELVQFCSVFVDWSSNGIQRSSKHEQTSKFILGSRWCPNVHFEPNDNSFTCPFSRQEMTYHGNVLLLRLKNRRSEKNAFKQRYTKWKCGFTWRRHLPNHAPEDWIKWS